MKAQQARTASTNAVVHLRESVPGVSGHFVRVRRGDDFPPGGDHPRQEAVLDLVRAWKEGQKSSEMHVTAGEETSEQAFLHGTLFSVLCHPVATCDCPDLCDSHETGIYEEHYAMRVSNVSLYRTASLSTELSLPTEKCLSASIKSHRNYYTCKCSIRKANKNCGPFSCHLKMGRNDARDPFLLTFGGLA